MNTRTLKCLAAFTLGLLHNTAHAEYWTVDALVKEFSLVSAQIARGELQAAEQSLDALRQHTASNDARLDQYRRELANAYLQQARQQLQAGNNAAAAITLSQGKPHLAAAAPALREQYQASLEAATAEQRQAEARAKAKAEAELARQAAERERQQKLDEARAAAERERAARMAAAAQATPEPVEVPVAAATPRPRLIDPNAASSSVPMPMLDANDRDSLRELLDQVAADVVAFDCAVRLEVREAKDYPFVAALLSARIKKLDPGFSPQLSPVFKPDQEPRLVLSPQSNG